MATRAFKTLTIAATNTAQPLIYSTLTAAVLAGDAVPVTVADGSIFLQGDWVLLQTAAGANAERALVIKVAVNVVTLKTLEKNHANAENMIFASPVNSVYAQGTDGNVANLSVGTLPTFTAAGLGYLLKMVKVATATQPIETKISRDGFPNAEDPSQYYILGTNPDTYTPSVGIV